MSSRFASLAGAVAAAALVLGGCSGGTPASPASTQTPSSTPSWGAASADGIEVTTGYVFAADSQASSSPMGGMEGMDGMDPATTTAAYLTVRNATDASVRLVGASTPAAREVQMHTTDTANGAGTMRQVDSFEVAAGGTLVLKSGGDHLMMMGLTEPLEAGTTINLTLDFETGQSGTDRLDVTLPVIERTQRPGA